MNNNTLFFRKIIGRSFSIGFLLLGGTLTNTAMANPTCSFLLVPPLSATVVGTTTIFGLPFVGQPVVNILTPSTCSLDLGACVATGLTQACTFTKLNSTTCTVQVSFTDSDGTTACDPVLTTLKVDTGHTVIQTFDKIPDAERYIDVVNLSPGLKKLIIRVNGQNYKKLKLKNNKTYHIDVAKAFALQPGNENTITFIGKGKVGSSALISVGDIAPAAQASPDKKAGNTGTWGPLVDALEDNTSDQVALAEKQEIHLELATVLDAKLATDASRYQVTVNGAPVNILQVIAKHSDEGTKLTLLPQWGSFITGDKVQVSWSLEDAKKQPLSGNVDLIAE